MGSRSVKLLQFSADRTRVIDAARWDLVPDESDGREEDEARLAAAITRARRGRQFQGRRAVFSVPSSDLIVQNIRVPHASGEELDRVVCSEAASRLPFPAEETEVRYLQTAAVRQADSPRLELILLACHRPKIQRTLRVAERAGLHPVAIDVEPTAMLRCYAKQFRRQQDQEERVVYANVGAAATGVVIAQGSHTMFVKYIDVGGCHLDQAVAEQFGMELSDAAALRRHNGERRADERDPEIAQSIGEAVRGPLDRLASELSRCLRYYSVTFRGQPLRRIVLSGGEASDTLRQFLADSLDIPCQLGDPLRNFQKSLPPGRVGQWDVAAGLALRETNR